MVVRYDTTPMQTTTKKQESDLRIFYIQVREDDVTRAEELAEFVRCSGLRQKQFTVCNVYEWPAFPVSAADGFDAVFVGGSSDASVLEKDKYPFVRPIGELLERAIDSKQPTFASCFGFQAVVEQLGGTVILDKENMEMGSYDLMLTPEAIGDTLFDDQPTPFVAISGHKERAETLPLGAVNVVTSAQCPFHAITFPGTPFYAFQFHPEVNDVDLIARITRYRDRYLDVDGHLQQIIREIRPTPDANALVRKFVERIVLRQEVT
jgi:GMP synthase (glutamine-hydrolysing)